MPKMLDWSAGTMSGLPYELWVGGYDEGQNAALESMGTSPHIPV